MFEAFSLLVNVVSVIAAIHFARKSHELERQQTANDSELGRLQEYGARLREYAKTTRVIEHEYVDVVLLGPRASGKTSIAELWTSPWTQIDEIAPSADWRNYEVNVHEFEPTERHDELFEVQRRYTRALRVRVRDYPGEDRYRVRAIRDLSGLGTKAVVIFVFKVGFSGGAIDYGEDNARYFSTVLVDAVHQHLHNVAGAVSKAIVVFNKADQLPSGWSASDTLEYLRLANRDAIHQVERLFSGNLEFHVTSALTNKGIIGLLGSVGKVTIVSPREEQRYDQHLQRIMQEFELRGV